MLRESTGWRDEALSRRHREWGVDCPAADVDCLLVEFDLGRPVAMVEYKHQNLRGTIDLRHPMYRAIREVADRAQLPAWVAYYWPGLWSFELHPFNGLSEQHIEPGRILTERQYVTFLYRLRSRVIRDELLPTLGDLLPDERRVG